MFLGKNLTVEYFCFSICVPLSTIGSQMGASKQTNKNPRYKYKQHKKDITLLIVKQHNVKVIQL